MVRGLVLEQFFAIPREKQMDMRIQDIYKHDEITQMAKDRFF